MSEAKAEKKSVVVHFAKSELEAVEIVALLEECGIRAAIESEWNPALDGVTANMKGYYARIFVLESDLERAEELIAEFQAEGTEP
ncbi:unnamed protein product [marine sediment metagenome]|uniref:DUF2007 domain-containing protein n=1 Tax=marine sediment metagenome TaxID=412755 RepID=X1ICY5_9ZZZZ